MVRDLTEIPTEEGKLYLASVAELYSGRLLGYALGERHDAELVPRLCSWPLPPAAAPSPV